MAVVSIVIFCKSSSSSYSCSSGGSSGARSSCNGSGSSSSSRSSSSLPISALNLSSIYPNLITFILELLFRSLGESDPVKLWAAFCSSDLPPRSSRFLRLFRKWYKIMYFSAFNFFKRVILLLGFQPANFIQLRFQFSVLLLGCS